jgi:outer membrane receptor protein involved in Fe transport
MNNPYMLLAKRLTIVCLHGVSAVALTAPAFGQDGEGQQAEAPDTNDDGIIVTGTRVRDPNLKSSSPVTAMTAQALQLSGSPTVDRLLNNLPQIAPSQNSTSNRGEGIVSVDLRKLGPTRTLVLVNSRRLVPSSGLGIVDLNSIPSSLLQRVEVVTGGASAVYGSDALAGVVNFILDDDYQGFGLRAENGVSERGDGINRLIEGTLGASFDDGRGNVVISVGYNRRGAIRAAEREGFGVSINGGSSTAPAGRIDNIGLNPNPTVGSLFGSGGTARDYAFTADGNGIRGFINSLPTATSPGDRYNFSDKEFLQIPLERLSVAALGHYNIAPSVTAFMEGFFTHNEVNMRQGESPLTAGTLSPTNPLLPQIARDMLAQRPNPAANASFQRRLTELGPRRQTVTTDALQINAGLRGKLGDGWEWEAYYGHGRSEQTRIIRGGASQSRINASLLGCPAGTVAAFGCRLIDFFGPNSLTAADIAYIAVDNAKDMTVFTRDAASASITGPIFQLPAGAVSAALGAEYRKDTFRYQPDDIRRRGDLAGFYPSLPTAGSFDVKEVFGELVVPLLADLPAIHRLTLEVGARYADYSSVGGVFTFKAGGSWEPIPDLRLRSLYQRATRAPSVFELYQGGDIAAQTFSDPCATIAPTGASRPAPSTAVAAICQLQGLADPRTAGFTQIISTLDVNSVGNANLSEETSKTLTVGAVLTPSFMPGFSLSFDYYRIAVSDYINRAFGGVNGVIASCFASGVTTAAQYSAHPACQFLSRRISGELIAELPLANVQTLKTSGFDIQANYSLPMRNVGLGDNGTIDFGAKATHIRKYDTVGQDYVGRISQNFGGIPDWRTSFDLGWRNDTANVRLQWRWMAGMVEDISQRKIPSVSYFDLAGSVKVGDKIEVYGGVNNMLDKRAPLVPNQIFNSDTQNYDIVGRYFFLGAKLRFQP